LVIEQLCVMGRKRRTQRVQTGADLDRARQKLKIQFCNLGEMQGAAPFFSLSW
jgi:hypothetical protein